MIYNIQRSRGADTPDLAIVVTTGIKPRLELPVYFCQLCTGGSTDLGTSASWKGINHSNLLPRHIRLIL